MKNLLLLLTFFVISSAFGADHSIKLTQQDLGAIAATGAEKRKEIPLLGTSLAIELELSSKQADVEVAIVEEGIGSSCSYTSPIQKTISKDWAEAKIELHFSPSNHSSEDSYCYVSILDKKAAKGILIKLKEFR